jgi:hypothetical protein
MIASCEYSLTTFSDRPKLNNYSRFYAVLSVKINRSASVSVKFVLSREKIAYFVSLFYSSAATVIVGGSITWPARVLIRGLLRV